ncbi:hypothetical protein DDZ18_08455 [Marinicauda salina]|uniref:Uncharacterized protein n=1 Tax=Marinicauda salina TaxID=2135793 RepID=A0A2U2BUL6_9PROT|nr:hypothetical protein [Marinicauda salina]PWE17679.1 hypothetical protein DDZ18_08455 [Marinicauda salina]
MIADFLETLDEAEAWSRSPTASRVREVADAGFDAARNSGLAPETAAACRTLAAFLEDLADRVERRRLIEEDDWLGVHRTLAELMPIFAHQLRGAFDCDQFMRQINRLRDAIESLDPPRARR